MDFSFTEEQLDVQALARRILEGGVSTDSLVALETGGGERFEPGLWKELAQADLLGIALPEEVGGSGYGLVEQCLVLQEVGRTIAPVPVWASIVCGALPVATFGSPAQKEAWARPAATGDRILTAALTEPVSRDHLQPATAATRDGDGWRLSGVKTAVPAATLADLVLVPATTPDGEVRVFLVEPSADGVRVEAQRTTNRDVAGLVELDGARVAGDAVLDGGAETVEWIVERATVGLCAMQLGVTEQAVHDTAEYTKQRVQFDRAIGTFQAVAHRAADCYIDVEGIRLTLWQALDRLASGLPAAREVAVAKFWAAQGGHRVANAVVHLHGGMGVATEYPIHRFFLNAKQLEFMLGGATDQLRRIGASLAGTP